MKTTFSPGGKSLVPMVGGEVASSSSANHRGLWSGSPMAQYNPVDSLVWGALLWGVLGCGCKRSLWGRILAPPPSLGLWGGWSLLPPVPFPVHCSGIRCWEENSVS